MARPVVVQNRPQMQRVTRRPKHSFYVHHRPWQLQPVCIAPVLVGETLQNFNFQVRAVTDPILNKLIGWHYESYWFYIKVQDLETTPGELTTMFVDPMADMSAFNEAADVKYYHHADSINWTERCLRKVVDDWFRNEGESPTGFDIDGVPLVSVGSESTWLNSMAVQTALLADDVTIPTVSGASTDDVLASDIEKAMIQWAINKQQGLTKMTFEEYLVQEGMRPSAGSMGRSEMLRYTREWSYPSNTVDPATGVPTSAVSWSVSERANKRRQFSQPGFILGVVCARPKVYRDNQSGSVAHSMNSAIKWLPSLLMGDTQASVITIDNAASGPLTGQSADYQIDLKDLLLYGDQFVNLTMATAGLNQVDLPTPAGGTRYVDSDDMNAMFFGASPANVVRADGVVQFDIVGRLVDTTP